MKKNMMPAVHNKLHVLWDRIHSIASIQVQARGESTLLDTCDRFAALSRNNMPV